MIKRRKRKDGSHGWVVRVKDRYGRWFPSETYERKVDAEACETRLKAQRHSGAVAPSHAQRRLTVDEFWEEWSRYREGQIHAGWQYTLHQMYRDYVKPVLGSKRLVDVESPDVGCVLANARKLGRSRQTQLHVYGLMHRMFEDAVDYYKLIGRNPVSKRDRPKVALKERNFLEPAESARLREATRDHWLGPAIWIGTYCGLRPCEIIALQKKHVDQERHQILIRQAFKRKAGINKIEPFPKQEDWGRAKIPAALRTYLYGLIEPMSDEDFVCRGMHRGMLNYAVLSRVLKVECKKAGVKVITPHELRHSCSEEWIQVGATETDVARQLNQKSSSTTKRYMHRTDGRLDLLAERIGTPAQPDEPAHLRLVLRK